MQHILIVEDDGSLAGALRLRLESEGFKVDHINDGQAAVEAIKSQNYDLILLDLMLPSLDGFQILERVRADGISTPIFVLTNLSTEGDRGRAVELGAQKYVVKSSTPLKDIITMIYEALNLEKSPAAAAA